MNRELWQFMQARFQTKFRFRNEFESTLTLKILLRLVTEHTESLLLTRHDVETMLGQSLDAPNIRRAYFPKQTMTMLETALDELSTLSIIVQAQVGRVRYPVFHSVQIDQVCDRIVFNLNIDVLPQLNQWSTELISESR
ncbi:hypothetical protein [Lactiplantibacillus daowaiensis]|uniref:Uncharacterized protein n=1 Tax=Lactiplantibacillus daowaiensis TaxID=2559918 RepID=A0ABW1S038_9LACO|nr:hypothetical protein [Lactiplantibacillus daowaiensis]